MHRFKSTFLLIVFLSIQLDIYTQPLNRKKIFDRHKIEITEVDTLNSLSLGNGRFAMTMDVTGLQTFVNEYAKGVPLGTQSEWGWHSFPTDKIYTIEQTMADIDYHGRKVPYARQWPSGTEEANATNYIRQNPHRIHLANVGWEILKSDGTPAKVEDITNIKQVLDMYKGELISTFYIGKSKVKVISIVDQSSDVLAVCVYSSLIKEGRLKLSINYPYPTDTFLDEANKFDENESNRLSLVEDTALKKSIKRVLDTTVYFTTISSDNQIIKYKPTLYGGVIEPQKNSNQWNFTIQFSQSRNTKSKSFKQVKLQNSISNKLYWQNGGIIDFGKVKDKRAHELERRMITSLYLTKVNCQGNTFPQETGLTYNSWFGKPHMEMSWWHGVHFPQWGRREILEKQMSWYFRALGGAEQMAHRQGFKGARWQKMTDPNGQETPSSVGSYLIWQQPHIIYFVNQLFNSSKNKEEVLKTYDHLITKTADFMADFAHFDKGRGYYILGPGVIAAQERFDPQKTINPTYELAYWVWGLDQAILWKKLLNKSYPAKWDEVKTKLSPLPVKDSLYLFASSAPDSYTNDHLLTDHPSVLAIFGMLPAVHDFDHEIMKNTYDKILKAWLWEDTWGWDFPMLAMTAARLEDGEGAVNALLMPITTNTYLKNGHNYQTERLRLYLPGNGGMLIALGMMANGTLENPKINMGFPQNWKVRSEGLYRIP
jgi:hypothetical protein